jgi:hypothetical protein
MANPQPAPTEQRPYGSVGRIDVKFADRLPAETKAIFTQLAEDAFVSASLGLALHHRALDISDEIAIQALKAERLRTQERQRDADGKAGSVRRLVESAREYMGRLDRGAEIKLHTGPAPVLKRGETAIDAVEARRRRVGELHADITRLETAPYPTANLKAKSRERIELLAAAGACDAYGAVEQDLPVIWPSAMIRLPDGSVISAPDAMGILAHLFSKQLIEAEARAIDAAGDDENALTAEDKTKALEQTRRDILATEREEIFFVGEANATGASIQFRLVDVRALCGLSSDMPPPRSS